MVERDFAFLFPKEVEAGDIIRKVKDSNVIKNMYWGSIVFDYYIRRIKKSSEIITE